MADITAVIIIALLVVGAVIALYMIKSVLKAFFLILLVAVMLIVAASYFIYKDVNDLSRNWPSSDKLLLLESEGGAEAAVHAALLEETSAFVGDADFSAIKAAYSREDLKSVKGSSYKVIIFNLETIADETESQEIRMAGARLMSKSDAVRLLKSEDALQELAQISAEQAAVIRLGDNLDSSQTKSAVFSLMLTQLFMEKGGDIMVYILAEYRDSRIMIYPETAVFRLINFLPDFIIDKVVNINQKEVDNDGNTE
jgi:hypothetical protein